MLGPLYAFRDAFSGLTGEPAYIRAESAGELDDLGLYELIRRRCHYVIVCDATKDPLYTFENLGNAIRRCRTELGVGIDIDLGPLRRREGYVSAHAQTAVIRYPDGESGTMLYIKPSLTGDEPSDVLQYAAANAEFPFETAGPNFDEAQFESYRRLGEHILQGLSDMLGSRPSDATEVSAGETAEPPAELVAAVASGRAVLWAGSGLGAQAGLPTWLRFLGDLLKTAQADGAVPAEVAKGIEASLETGDFDLAADELMHALPRGVLSDRTRSALSAAEPSQAHRLLAGMPFRGALTTGWDQLTARAFDTPAMVAADAERLVASLQGGKRFVANVLGTFATPESLVFTAREFRAMLGRFPAFKQFLGSLVLRNQVVFAGFSVSGIRDCLDALELPQVPEQRHYALVAQSDRADPTTLRYLERTYNVHAIEYLPGYNYGGLTALLERLESHVRRSASAVEPSGLLTLNRVTLKNIGPFTSLDLELANEWNLLLGDNGVGKTVVLRAIAAALSGDAADPAAVKRLLRTGTNSGSIRLQVQGREYAVELKRDAEGVVKIDSASLSPVKYDNWLVIGFPALRGVPWVSVEGPSRSTAERPSAKDLAAILRGDADSRGANLKQWLVNLDYASTKDSSARDALDRFFGVLADLTPGVNLKLESIDPRTWDVLVRTENGVAPLEAVSQGTASVMCWIGTLIQRLSDTKRNNALVLIDEIDAHMHPKWQQLFVEAFRSRFKGTQVIASTHSPLLVGSLKPEELWLVARSPIRTAIYGMAEVKTEAGETVVTVIGPEEEASDGGFKPRDIRQYPIPPGVTVRVRDGEIVEVGEALTIEEATVTAEHIGIYQKGSRVDQILTSPLFGLESTRDTETAKTIMEYSRLAAIENPTEEQKADLARYAAELKIRAPGEHEREAARKASELITDYAAERLGTLPEPAKREVLQEVKVQLLESLTGSKRPQ